METDWTAIWTPEEQFVSGVVMAYQHPMASLAGDDARAGARVAVVAWWLHSSVGGPRPEVAAAGAVVVDPTKAKQLESFTDEYKKLVETFQEDADYQTKLRAAYQENAGAVAQVSAAHAADTAQLRLLETAQRDHVTATQAEIAAVRSAASAAELAAKAAQEQKTVTDAMAAAQKTYDDAVLKVMDETDGLTEKQQKLADMLGILEQKLLSGAIDWDEYAARAKAAEQLITSGGADKGMAEFARGLSSDLDSLIGKLHGRFRAQKGREHLRAIQKGYGRVHRVNREAPTEARGNQPAAQFAGARRRQGLANSLGQLWRRRRDRRRRRGGGLQLNRNARRARQAARLPARRGIRGRRDGRHGQPARRIQGDAGRAGQRRRSQ